jgi:hypothetical protein
VPASSRLKHWTTRSCDAHHAIPSASVETQRRVATRRAAVDGAAVADRPDAGAGLPVAVRNIDLEDLLGRDAVRSIRPHVEALLRGRVVMVTHGIALSMREARRLVPRRIASARSLRFAAPCRSSRDCEVPSVMKWRYRPTRPRRRTR